MIEEASTTPGDGHGMQTPSTPAHWLEQAIPEDAVFGDGHDAMPLREHPQLRKYATVADMAKSLLHAQSLVGRKAVGLVRPGEGAAPEEWDTWRTELRQMMGVPEDPMGYDIAVPEGLAADEGLMDWFRGAAHGLGLSPDQAQGLSDRYSEWLGQAAGEFNRSREALRHETMRDLGMRWGGDAGLNMERARRGFDHFARKAGLDDAHRVALLSAHGDDPTMIRLFHSIGMAFTEDDFVDGGHGPSPRGEVLSPERFFAEKVFGGKGE